MENSSANLRQEQRISNYGIQSRDSVRVQRDAPSVRAATMKSTKDVDIAAPSFEGRDTSEYQSPVKPMKQDNVVPNFVEKEGRNIEKPTGRTIDAPVDKTSYNTSKTTKYDTSRYEASSPSVNSRVNYKTSSNPSGNVEPRYEKTVTEPKRERTRDDVQKPSASTSIGQVQSYVENEGKKIQQPTGRDIPGESNNLRGSAGLNSGNNNSGIDAGDI